MQSGKPWCALLYDNYTYDATTMSKSLRFSIKFFKKVFHSLHCRKILNGLHTKGL
jgi:hypothetical protein